MSFGVTINEAAVHSLLSGPSSDVARYMQRIGIQVATSAKRRCPVDSGRLRASIGVSQSNTGAGITTHVTANTDYAIYVHEGTRFMPGRPFLRDALKDINV